MLALDGTYAPTVIHGRLRSDAMGQEVGRRRFYRLLLAQEGRFEVTCGRDHFHADPGDVYLVAPGCDYRCAGHPHKQSMMIAFTVRACVLHRLPAPKQARRFPADAPAQPDPVAVWGCALPSLLPRPLADAIRDSIVFIAATWWRSDDHHFEANQRLAYVLGRLAHYGRSRLPSAVADEPGDHPIARVLHVIHEHYPTLQTAADIAAQLGLSVSRLNASFRAAAGETPVACLRRYRLAEAERLLLSTDGSIQAIATMVGFRSGKALHKAWMATHELSPRAWRRRHRR